MSKTNNLVKFEHLPTVRIFEPCQTFTIKDFRLRFFSRMIQRGYVGDMESTDFLAAMYLYLNHLQINGVIVADGVGAYRYTRKEIILEFDFLGLKKFNFDELQPKAKKRCGKGA